VDSLRGGDVLCGVTLLNDKLYVLGRARGFDLTTWFGFHVYSTDNSTWQPQLEHLEHMVRVSGRDLKDVASCTAHQCLYVCDFGAKSILKLSLDAEVVSSWSVEEAPVGISVMPHTDGCRLLITPSESNTLLQLDCETGQCSRFVNLPDEVQSPRHAVLLPGGEILVSHGEPNGHRVRQISADGDIIYTFGDEADCLNLPCQVRAL